ncbi:scarecrow-like protein 9 [Carex littledalei]|uniref:Scarecrow-like protein 9 n=1 Tax=Carex littledalei TaxID=544730 RepID=A0A833QQ61_9POAL|nr:scarecrow-like protein 9 [Carex littledalei]
MVFGSGNQDSSGTMNELTYDSFFFEDNPLYNSFNQSQPFLDQGLHSNLPQANTIPVTDPNGDLHFNLPQADLTSDFKEINLDFTVDKRGESPEYCEITSNISLDYISQMLLEEGIDEKIHSYCEEAAIRETEKPFYDILGQEYPPSSSGRVSPGGSDPVIHQSFNSPCDSCSTSNSVSVSSSSTNNSSGVVDSNWTQFNASDFSVNVKTFPEETAVNAGPTVDLTVEDLPFWHFEKGIEEAKKFLPNINKLVIDLEVNQISTRPEPKKEAQPVGIVKSEVQDQERQIVKFGTVGRKNPFDENLELSEGRFSKHSAVSSDEPVRDANFDKVLLSDGSHCNDEISNLREKMKYKGSKSSKDNQEKRKVQSKKQSKGGVVDLRSLLINCAQAISSDNWRQAHELLKKIRKHASPDGDGSQRLASCFADGLEARLAGTGSQVYHRLMAKRTTATDYLKAYRLYLAACPFKRATYYFSNKTIVNSTKGALRIHIIDFGICFGFQWPSLIEHLAKRPGPTPRLRITGIDVPKPGFRPAEQVEETGRRLKEYANSFNVPFEYRGIALKWDMIRVEDLRIRQDEVVIVNCLYRFRNLVDETVTMDSPRDRVLKTIRQINPRVFIHAIVNGSYGAPFFVTRFREALFHYSSLFDILDTTVPRDNEQRGLIERGIFGRDIINVIACEGADRVERPETYRQWQIRNLRAGFEQLPLDSEMFNFMKRRVKELHHKDFVIDEDSKWLLQGWKGRIVYAMSTWKPSNS